MREGMFENGAGDGQLGMFRAGASGVIGRAGAEKSHGNKNDTVATGERVQVGIARLQVNASVEVGAAGFIKRHLVAVARNGDQANVADGIVGKIDASVLAEPGE